MGTTADAIGPSADAIARTLGLVEDLVEDLTHVLGDGLDHGEDLFQDVADQVRCGHTQVVRAFRARHKIDPDRPFYAWLYQIIRRLCFNHTRDRRTRRQGIEAAGNWLADQAQARTAGMNPDRALECAETKARVHEALEGLTDRDREVLVLKEFEGLRYREIAELLGIPIGTVMSRLYTARRRLAASLEDVR